jgi:hypothetical protein
VTPQRLRYGALLLAVVGFEAVWVSFGSYVLGPPPDGGAVPWLPLFLVGSVLVLGNQWLWGRKSRAASFGVALLLITLLMWRLAPEPVGLLGLAGWPRVIIGAWEFLARPVPFTIIAASGFVMWYRALAMLQEPVSLVFTAARLRRSAVYVAVALVAAGIRHVPLPVYQVFIFVAFGLAALALARADTVSQLPEAGRLPFNGRWLANLLGGIALALTLGLAATLLFSMRGMAFLADLFRPVILAVSWLFAQLLVALASLLAPAIEGFYAQVPATPTRAIPTPAPLPTPAEVDATLGTPLYDNNLLFIILGVGVLLFLYFVYRLLRKAPTERDDEELEGTQPQYGRVPIQWNPADWLRQQAAALGDRLRGQPRREFGIENVRDLYRNLLLFGDEHGLPRPIEQTPYEYLRPLSQWYPQRRDDFRALTDAYVATHYGERDFARAEVERLQAAWRRIASEPLPEPTEQSEVQP